MRKKKINRHAHQSEPIYYSDVQISVDTMILVAKLSYEQQEELCERIVLEQRTQYQDKYFHYSRKINNIIIKTFPRNPLMNINYNTMLIFEKKASSATIPYAILEILQFDTWKIKRLDLAFDFSNNTPFSTFQNRLILKHHGNVKFLQQGKGPNNWNSEYLGTTNSKTEAKACCYDRNKKEADYGDPSVQHDHPLRFEVRLYPKLNEFNFLKRIDHGWIETKLSKFIFVPDIEQLPLNKWDKRKLYKIQEDYDYLKSIKPLVKQKEIKQAIRDNRVPFEEIYASNKETFFSFLKMQPIQVGENVQYTEQLSLDEDLWADKT